MDDNIDCSPDTTSFSDGYKAGWKARGEYIRDYRDSHSGTSFGLALMMIGGLVFIVFLATLITMPVVVERVIVALLCSVAVIGLGYFINKSENKSFNKKQAKFKEKWSD